MRTKDTHKQCRVPIDVHKRLTAIAKFRGQLISAVISDALALLEKKLNVKQEVTS